MKQRTDTLVLCLHNNKHIIVIKTLFVLVHIYTIYAKIPVKFRTKFWMVCDATTYAGREEREIGLGEHVTLSLMEQNKNTILHAITDNIFTSLKRARKLYRVTLHWLVL